MNQPIQNIRKLTILLAISGSLNIIFASIIFYLATSERPPTPYFELRPAKGGEQQAPLAIERSDSEVIRYFRRMPLQWLISRLKNTQLVENGYTQRDLALASLVAFHDFDLERAFSGLPKPDQKRRMIYGSFSDGRQAELIVYPGLSDQHFNAICSFTATERWPLTSRGLFLALQKEEKENDDPSLADTFFMTSEFSSLEMLFRRNHVTVVKEELLKVVLEGNWIMLSNFAEKQKISQDLSAARRQNFLLEYIQKKSKAAAQLMLKTDGSFAARKLDDKQVLLLLQLIDEKSPQAEQFALTVLTSPRSDAVLKLAAERLYEYNGAVIPDAALHQAALSRFALSDTAIIEVPKPTYKPRPELLDASRSSLHEKPGPIPSQKQAKEAIGSNEASKKITENRPVQKKLSAGMERPKTTPIRKLPQTTQNKDFYYVVREGDTLWKISRKFSVDIEVLRAFNQLETDILRPGVTLRIPLIRPQ